jgi:hypothetical protein
LSVESRLTLPMVAEYAEAAQTRYPEKYDYRTTFQLCGARDMPAGKAPATRLAAPPSGLTRNG